MRPPVAAEEGNSPLRGKNAQRVFQYANGMRDPTGFKVTKEQVIQNYTDDGKLSDTRWNGRHNKTPSEFNGTNHNFYKQYFDKDNRMTEGGKIRELSQ